MLEAPSSTIVKLAEEHAYVELSTGGRARARPAVRVVPNHACVVVNLFDELVVTRNGTPRPRGPSPRAAAHSDRAVAPLQRADRTELGRNEVHLRDLLRASDPRVHRARRGTLRSELERWGPKYARRSQEHSPRSPESPPRSDIDLTRTEGPIHRGFRATPDHACRRSATPPPRTLRFGRDAVPTVTGAGRWRPPSRARARTRGATHPLLERFLRWGLWPGGRRSGESE